MGGVVTTADGVIVAVARLRSSLTGAARALAAFGASAHRSITEMSLRTLDRRARRTAGTVALVAARAFAIAGPLLPCRDQLAEIAVGATVTTADGIPDIRAAAHDGFTGAAFRAGAAVGASIEAELTLGTLAATGNTATRFTGAVMVD